MGRLSRFTHLRGLMSCSRGNIINHGNESWQLHEPPHKKGLAMTRIWYSIRL
jgi:hypothetical protein